MAKPPKSGKPSLRGRPRLPLPSPVSGRTVGASSSRRPSHRRSRGALWLDAASVSVSCGLDRARVHHCNDLLTRAGERHAGDLAAVERQPERAADRLSPSRSMSL